MRASLRGGNGGNGGNSGGRAAGCSQQGSTQSGPRAASVVASTDVWGSVAGAVAGDHAAVTSILDSAVDDPHSYEASPPTPPRSPMLRWWSSTAAITTIGSSMCWPDHPDVPTVDAYSLRPDVAAARQRTRLLRPGDRQGRRRTGRRPASRRSIPPTPTPIAANAAAFAHKSRRDPDVGAHRSARNIPARRWWRPKPVAHYLLVNAGITDKTPEGFSNAIEEDTDPSPADLAAMLDLISTRQVSALVYNPQTETAVTKQLLQDAANRPRYPW